MNRRDFIRKGITGAIAAIIGSKIGSIDSIAGLVMPQEENVNLHDTDLHIQLSGYSNDTSHFDLVDDTRSIGTWWDIDTDSYVIQNATS